jgi:hypothetical protein
MLTEATGKRSALKWTVGVHGTEASRIDTTSISTPWWAQTRVGKSQNRSRHPTFQAHGGDAPQFSAPQAAGVPTGIHLDGGIQ